MKTRVKFISFEDVTNSPVALWTSAFHELNSISYRIKLDAPFGEFELPHSMAATPGRYLEAALSNQIQLDSETEFFVVLNPGVKYLPALLQEVRDSFYRRYMDAPVGVISAFNGLVAGYFFKRDILQKSDQRKYLRFLSGCSGGADFELLRAIFGAKEVSLTQFDLSLALVRDTSFFICGLENVLVMQAGHATRYLLSGKKGRAIAVMPYHAGDLLFFCEALKSVEHPFDHLLVNSEFVDIVSRSLPNLKLVVMPETSIARGKDSDDENTSHMNIENHYFMEVGTQYLNSDDLFYYFRPIRNYNVSKLHMINQWQFSLSDHYDLLPPQTPRTGTPKTTDKSILIHFDGGWPLKILAVQEQKKLIDTLKSRGYRITVLTGRAAEYDVPSEDFKNLAQLENLISNHSLFLGMDSFPAHFSTLVLGHPTVCLFSSTRPENSNGVNRREYRSISKGMGCSPCYGIHICPRFGLDHCVNFSEVPEIMNALEKMYQDCYVS